MIGQRHFLLTLSPGKIRYSLYRRLGGPQGRSGLVRKILPLPGTHAVQKYISHLMTHVFFQCFLYFHLKNTITLVLIHLTQRPDCYNFNFSLLLVIKNAFNSVSVRHTCTTNLTGLDCVNLCISVQKHTYVPGTKSLLKN